MLSPVAPTTSTFRRASNASSSLCTALGEASCKELTERKSKNDELEYWWARVLLGGFDDGEPFFAAISALRVGVDLLHMLCSPVSAGSIKAYSPDLIPHPVFAADAGPDAVHDELDALLARLYVLAIGSVVGRSESKQNPACDTLQLVRQRDVYVVIDADGLYMVQQRPDVVNRAVLTPNVVEYGRICELLLSSSSSCAFIQYSVQSQRLDNDVKASGSLLLWEASRCRRKLRQT